MADVPTLPTVDISHVALCSVGRWNDRDYTRDELAEAVAAAREIGDAYHAPLKLGHAEGQQFLPDSRGTRESGRFLDQPDGDPALGWIENLSLEGDTLYGDFKAVPEKLAQLIKAGAYRGRSCEFWLNGEYGGTLRPLMLKAVALLGIDAPAVEGLDDITALYNTRADLARVLDAQAGVVTTLAGEKPYKTEGGTKYHVSDYAYTPDDADPSTWKLRIVKSPGGKPDAGQVGAAIAAYGKGFRGQKVKIAAADKGKVKSRLRGAWRAANPDRGEDEMPDAIKNSRSRLGTLLLRALRLADGEESDEPAPASGGLVGAKLADIQTAVEDALAASYPPAEPEEDSDEPSADGPSQNVIDWFLNDDPPYVIVSDQDVDNLWMIPFAYDGDSDSATLGAPVPVKGTYTPNTSGEETGEAAEEDGTASTPEAPPEDQMATATEEMHALALLCRSEPDDAALTALGAAIPDRETLLLLEATDGQKLVQQVIAAIDKALGQLGEGASGRPGMGFIRTALAEVKRKLGSMKFPQAQMAAPKLTRGGDDVDRATLAQRIGLPQTASEAQIERRLAHLTRAPAGSHANSDSRGYPPARTTARDAPPEMTQTVATLSQTVAALRAERDGERLEAAFTAAAKAGRLTPPVREELRTLARSAGVDAAIRVVDTLPVVVDLVEHGRDGDTPGTLRGQLSPGALAILRRDYGAGFVESLADQRPLHEKRDALQRGLETERQQARLSRRQGGG